MDMKDMRFCQSCAMPLSDEILGTENDGSKNQDYCEYCYKDGAFTYPDCTMEQMIDICTEPMIEANPGMTKEQAKTSMQEFFPQLKRWAK